MLYLIPLGAFFFVLFAFAAANRIHTGKSWVWSAMFSALGFALFVSVFSIALNP